MTITPKIAAVRIERAIENKRLIQGEWHIGTCAASLLGSIDPSVKSPNADCLAGVAPNWLFRWTVEAFDNIPKDKIYEAAALFAAMLWRELTVSQWETVNLKFRAWLIEDALTSAKQIGIPVEINEAWNDAITVLRSGGTQEEAKKVAVAWPWIVARAARRARTVSAALQAMNSAIYNTVDIAASEAAHAAGVWRWEKETLNAGKQLYDAVWDEKIATMAVEEARNRQFQALARIACEIGKEKL